MSNTSGPAMLDEIRRAAHQRYGNYELQLSDGSVVVLRAPLRLPSDERTRLMQMHRQINTLQDDPNATDADLLEFFRSAFVLVADGQMAGEKLVDEIGEDLAVMQTLFEQYAERTQPGEASNSPS